MASAISFAVFFATILYVLGHGLDWYVPNNVSLGTLDMGDHNQLTVTYDRRNRSFGKNFSTWQVPNVGSYNNCSITPGSVFLQGPAPANTSFKWPLPAGTYYFIDGILANCQAGAKAIVIYGNGAGYSTNSTNSTNSTTAGTGTTSGSASGSGSTTGTGSGTGGNAPAAVSDRPGSALAHGFSWLLLATSMATILMAA